MRLRKLIEVLDSLEATLKDIEIDGIACDSRKVLKDFLFVAVKGPNDDGHKFIDVAVKNGAKVVVFENRYIKLSKAIKRQAYFIRVPNSRLALIQLAARFYNYPSRALKVIGVTGTNGKTTITYLLEKILTVAGYSCGVIGTVNYRLKNKVLPAKNTTPGPIDLQKLLADMRIVKIDYAIVEVSSHALHQNRVGLIDFSTAVFTNLTQDHLDYHRNLENYFLAKAKLFQSLKKSSYAIINSDDLCAKRLIRLTKAKIITYGLKNATVVAKDIKLGADLSEFLVIFPKGKILIKTKLIGRHNVYNILASVGAALSQGINHTAIKKGIESLDSVSGRLEQINCGQPFKVLVDYAHTEDALRNVLSSLKDIFHRRIIVVFGCGGNRDKTKRPKMGAVASNLADYAIITSDNPRSEDPRDIAKQVVKGIKKNNLEIILNRQAAIKKAFHLAKENDIVLVAGKGHEAHQIFKDKIIKFDDRCVCRQLLKSIVPCKINEDCIDYTDF